MRDSPSRYRFAEGRWVKSEPPQWYARAEKNGSWPSMITSVGAVFVADYSGDGEGDQIEIFQGPDGDYAIFFWDCNQCFAEVFIDNVADYLTFKSTVIAPQAVLIMESERHEQWQEERKRRRAS